MTGTVASRHPFNDIDQTWETSTWTCLLRFALSACWTLQWPWKMCVRSRETSLFDSWSHGASSIHRGASSCLPMNFKKALNSTPSVPCRWFDIQPDTNNARICFVLLKINADVTLTSSELDHCSNTKETDVFKRKEHCCRALLPVDEFRMSSRSIRSSLQALNRSMINSKTSALSKWIFFFFQVMNTTYTNKQYSETNSMNKTTLDRFFDTSLPYANYNSSWYLTMYRHRNKREAVVFPWTIYFPPCLYAAISRSYLSFSVRALSS